MTGEDLPGPRSLEGRAQVLVVDDEPRVLTAIRRLLRRFPLDLTLTNSPEDALDRLKREDYAVIVSDQRMPGMEGTHLLERAREISPDTVRLMMTGHVDSHAAVAAINQGGVARFLAKPWNEDELRGAIIQAVEQHRLVVQNRRLQSLTERQNSQLRALNDEMSARRQGEIDIASRIQTQLLTGPQRLSAAGLSAAAFTLPSVEVDGDFYDVFDFGEGRVDVLVGDVMGKGVPAALLSAAVKTQFIRALNPVWNPGGASADLPGPAGVVNRVHQSLSGRLIDLERFVTVCFARFDLPAATLRLVDCGHPRVLCVGADGAVRAFGSSHVPLGFRTDETYGEQTAALHPGDVFLFYSDGVTEARDEAGIVFGEERLAQTLAASAPGGPDRVLDAVRDAVSAQAAGRPPADDLTMVAVRIEGGA